MRACCSPYLSAADQHFGEKKVAEELKRFREGGPGPTTSMLVDGIVQSGALHSTVLDIGSGVGALALALLERGATKAIAVDASSAYVNAAREEAKRRKLTDVIQFLHADFVEAAPTLTAADVVTLDRVVCCYPSSEQLLQAALDRAQLCIALSYPRDIWYVRLAMGMENAQRWFAGNPFRTFVHPVTKIGETIRRAGFRLSRRRQTWMWSADVYIR